MESLGDAQRIADEYGKENKEGGSKKKGGFFSRKQSASGSPEAPPKKDKPAPSRQARGSTALDKIQESSVAMVCMFLATLGLLSGVGWLLAYFKLIPGL